MVKSLAANGKPMFITLLISLLIWAALQISGYFNIPPTLAYRQTLIAQRIDSNQLVFSVIEATFKNHSTTKAILNVEATLSYNPQGSNPDTTYPTFTRAIIIAIPPAARRYGITTDSDSLTATFNAIQPQNTYKIRFTAISRPGQNIYPQIAITCRQSILAQPESPREWVYDHWIWLVLLTFAGSVITLVITLGSSPVDSPQIPHPPTTDN